jgi:hypothetical protein
MVEQRYTTESTEHAFPDSAPEWGVFDWKHGRWVQAHMTEARWRSPIKALANQKSAELNLKGV